MPDKPRPEPVLGDLPPADPAEAVHIETPVIHMEDVAHKPSPGTRVSNKGVKVPPPMDVADRHDIAREDEDALKAMEKIEKSLRRGKRG